MPLPVESSGTSHPSPENPDALGIRLLGHLEATPALQSAQLSTDSTKEVKKTWLQH